MISGARLNCVSHLRGLVPCGKRPRENVRLPRRLTRGAYDDLATLVRRRFIKPRHWGDSAQGEGGICASLLPVIPDFSPRQLQHNIGTRIPGLRAQGPRLI